MSQKIITKVQKRDGTIIDFDQSKITKAIFKAITITGRGDGNRSKKLSDKVVQILNRRFKKNEIPNVEQIQDIVEEVLILEGLVETAKAYILYREQRRRIREAITISEEAVERMDQYLEKLDWEVQENANMAFSLQGLNHYSVSYVVKKYWLNKIYPQEVREANESGDFHLHNLDTLGVYCAGWDLYDLLLKGFGGVPGKVASAPAKHFRSVLGQVVNFIFTIQGEVAGAVAFSNFDTLLAPFIRYDNLNYQQVKQALQEFMFNMAVPTRVGFQNPFSNITLDLKPSPTFAKQPVIIGGKPQKETYGEFQEEMKVFDKTLYEVILEGDKNQRVFSFPIPTINITKDFPWQESAFDGIFEASAKYGINYFANYINSDMRPEDVRSMCKLPTCQIIYRNTEGEIVKTEIRRIVDDFILRGNQIEVLINGEFKPVTDIVKIRLENEDILKITLDNGIIDKMTLDHPSVIIKDGKLEIVESRNLKVGDEFPVNKYPYEGKLGDFDLGRLIGLYIGDGWISHNGATVNFVFNKNENNLIKLVEIISKRFAAKATVYFNKKHNYSKVSIASRSLSELIKEYVRGENSLDKRINSKTFGRSIEFRKGTIIGIVESDGFVGPKKDFIVLHLGNRELILDIFMLARSLGVNTTYFESNNKTGDKKKIGYNLRFARGVPDWLGNYFGLKTGKNLKYKEYKDFYGVKIRKIEKIKYTGYVYDFEVDSKEHLFQLANGVITHNCCRLRLNLNELYNRGGGGLFGSGSKTGSIGVVTINLPRIGYLSKTKKEFLERLGKMMDLAEESLEIKRKAIENFIEKGLYPYSRFYLSDIKKARGGYYANHFATIGLVGMNEAALNFIGENIASKRGRNFALEILDFMRKRLVKYQEETGNIYNLEQTPAESTSYRLALKDKEKYPDIITVGTKKVPFYTNSSQLPVNYTDDIFEALKLQDELTCKYTGGSVLHFFLGERINDVQTVKNLVKKVFENFHLPYITLTPTFCYDEKTEILTENGWKLFSELANDEKILTANPETKELNCQRPLRKFKFSYQGTMIHFKSKTFDCMVTPDHRMLVTGKKIKMKDSKTGKFIKSTKVDYFVKAQDISSVDKVPMTGYKWKGKNQSFFILPNVINSKTILSTKIKRLLAKNKTETEIAALCNCSQSFVSMVETGNRGRVKNYSAIKIPMSNWLKFFGIWLAEGSVRGSKGGDVISKYKYEVAITQKNNQVRDEIKGLLKKLPFKFSESPHGFYIYNKQLWEYLKQFGNSKTKYIPKQLKILPPKMLRLLLKWYLKGDGIKGTNYCSSVSKRLRDDLQEIYLKIGFDASILNKGNRGIVTKRTHKYTYLKEIQHKVKYSGYVYCVEVPNHVIYVRRNNKPNFSGNSICPSHGYLAGEHFFCPQCTIKQPCEVYSRIVGYLRPVRQWNEGKQEEFKQRKEYKLPKLAGIK